jgi:hypothetical protein
MQKLRQRSSFITTPKWGKLIPMADVEGREACLAVADNARERLLLECSTSRPFPRAGRQARTSQQGHPMADVYSRIHLEVC